MPDQNSSNNNANGFIPLLPFYVYVLIDPSDETVFYVGKGQGERALDHAAEVKRLITQGVILESKKHQRIKKILDNNLEPKTRVVARFDDERQAHAVESTLINFVYDYENNLTNAVRGQGAEFIRPFGDWQQRLGIDIPDRIRSQDGIYTAEKIKALRAAGSYKLLDRIREQLNFRGFACRDFLVGTSDRPYDPGESNGWLGLIVHIHGIDFMVSLSKECKPSIGIANTLATRNTNAYDGLARIEAVMGADFHAASPKNTQVKGEDRYRDFENAQRVLKNGKPARTKPTFDPDNLEALFELLSKFRDVLSAAPRTPA